MDLPDAEGKLEELKEQLQNPDGKFDGYLQIIMPVSVKIWCPKSY